MSLLVSLCLAALFLHRPIQAENREIRRVLVFSEVRDSSPVIRLIDQGIRGALDNSSYQIQLYREYFETVLFPDATTQQQFRNWYLQKYRDRRPDLIITVGPSPLRFIIDSHDTYFRDVPIVFCSVGVEAEDRLKLDSHFTGVWQNFMPSKTLDAALALKPGTKHVVVVGGVFSVDRRIEEIVRDSLHSYESKLDITYLADLAMPQLIERVAHLPEHTIILFTSLAEDAAGRRFLSASQSAPMIVQAANAPVFVMNDVSLGHGEIGGYLVSYAAEGEIAGAMALRILQGERPRDIPIVEGTNTYMFDWRALRRWAFIERNLPTGSVILNRPPSFWDLHKRYIIAGIFLLLAQTLIIAALLWQRAKRKQADAELIRTNEQLRFAMNEAQESEQRFRLVANSAPVLIWMSGLDKLCTYFNAPWLEFTGRSIQEELGNGWTTGIHPADLNQCLNTYTDRFDRRASLQMEYRLRRHDGKYRWVSDLGVPRFLSDGSFAGYIGTCIDVTERKLAEDALSNASRRLIEAHEEERTWLARELHDDVNQRLSLLVVNLDQLRQDSPDPATEVAKRIEEAMTQVSELANDVQALSHRLHSSKLDYLGLGAAAASFCREVCNRQRVEIDFQSHGVPQKLPHEISLCLYRVLQEALQNAIKHSDSRKLEVSLAFISNEIQMTVRDSGIGFDSEEALKGSGLGLTSMRERLKLVDGHLSIESQRGAGTVVRASVPISPGIAVARAVSTST
jgi:PAS domain S-box-containing protein